MDMPVSNDGSDMGEEGTSVLFPGRSVPLLGGGSDVSLIDMAMDRDFAPTGRRAGPALFN